jgi:hypothetical protein
MEAGMDNQQTKTHWKQLQDPRYIGAYALPNGNDLIVTITRVQKEEVTMMGGKKEDHTIVYLADQKPLILNVTNSKSIAKLYGAYIEDWEGKDITLYASTTKMGGEIVECLRVRPAVPKKQKPAITADRLTKAIASIVSGQYTTEKLRAQFDLTDDQEKQVSDSVKAAAEGANA